MGNAPALFVRAVGGDGVIHVAHRAHARKDADLVAFQAVRIARAVDFLMVMQADIDHRRCHGLRVHEYLHAQLGVGLNDLEFVAGQAARFVEHRRGNHHFADIVHQPGHTGLTDLIVRHAHAFGQRNHQRADRHRVHVGVLVGGLQAGQADQRVRMAQDRIGDFLHQQLHIADIHGPAHARFGKHGHDRVSGPSADQPGA